MEYILAVIIWGVIWGFATKAVINNKGYDENWFWWGFFFGFIALIVAACKPQNHVSYDYAAASYLSAAAEEKRKQQTISSGGWKCSRCGKVNPSYTGTCSCGMSKSDSEARAKAKIEAAKEKEKKDKELENIEKLKSYKDLLDSGVITEEEFKKKKEELLNI